VDPVTLNSEPKLLTFLCRLHYRRLPIPEILLAHLNAMLDQRFAHWPLKTLLRDRAQFWSFLQERWPIFIRETDGGRQLANEPGVDSLRVPGPKHLPFGHDDVRVFIDTLFSDGILTPIPWDWSEAASERWVRVGLLDPDAQNPALRLEELLNSLGSAVPKRDGGTADWQAFALRWAQLRYLWLTTPKANRERLQAKYGAVRAKVDDEFSGWMKDVYPRIHNQPALSLPMVHHIPACLARMLSSGEAKRIALILVDGLALEQWMAAKAILQLDLPGVLLEESASFAWLPSVTPISRQAIFSGKMPYYFPESLSDTGADEKRWGQFWSGRGLAKHEIGFIAMSGESDSAERVSEILTEDTKALGITLYKVDKIMHGMQLGSEGMINQVEQWARTEALFNLIHTLLMKGFTVTLTADHGNTEAVGIGAPKQGVLCESRGERNRLFTEKTFADDCVRASPGSRIAQHSGLPANIIPVIAPPGRAFTDKGQKIVCHGGDSLEEMAVPFVVLRKHTEGGA